MAKQRVAGAQLVDTEDAPADLLDASTLRSVARSAAGVPAAEDRKDEEFERNALGKLVINDSVERTQSKSKQSQGKDGGVFDERSKRKRKQSDAFDSDDSDMEDLKDIKGLQRAYKQTENAASLKQAGSYAHSQRTARSARSNATLRGHARGKNGKSSGDAAARFKAKRASGDVKGGSKVEPFAYWQLDKNLLNTRSRKKRDAKSKLGSVVGTEAPARGGKAKKRQRV